MCHHNEGEANDEDLVNERKASQVVEEVNEVLVSLVVEVGANETIWVVCLRVLGQLHPFWSPAKRSEGRVSGR